MIDAAKRDKAIEDPVQYIKEQMQFQLSEGLKAEEYGLNDLFVNLVDGGQERVNDWARAGRKGQQIVESATAVTTADFALIAEQLAFSVVLDAYTLATGISDKLATTFPSVYQETELIPGVAVTSDEYATPIPEGKPYPLVGMTPSTIRLPAAEKRGGILPITREMIIRDNTGLLLQRAQTVGQGMGLSKEKRIIDTFIGADPSYIRKEEARATYAVSAAGTNMGFTNLGTEILTDFTDIRILSDLFYAMSDPDINEPLDVSPTTIVCGDNLAWQARSIVRNVQVRDGTGARVARATPTVGVDTDIIGINDGNRIPFDLEIVHNEFLIRRLIARTGAGGLTSGDRALSNAHWWFGNPMKAFVYKEIWAMTSEQAPLNNEAQFEKDTWFRIKVSEKGIPGIREPRAIIRSDGTVAT